MILLRGIPTIYLLGIKLLMWDWDSLFMAHGVNQPSQAKAQARRALYWLLNPVGLEITKNKVYNRGYVYEDEKPEYQQRAKRKQWAAVGEHGV